LSKEKYDGLVETLEIMFDPEVCKKLREGFEDPAKKLLLPWKTC
jgi:hypothetical protein